MVPPGTSPGAVTGGLPQEEAGRIRFVRLESNGDFVFAARQGSRLSYTFVNLTKAYYGELIDLTRKWFEE